MRVAVWETGQKLAPGCLFSGRTDDQASGDAATNVTPWDGFSAAWKEGTCIAASPPCKWSYMALLDSGVGGQALQIPGAGGETGRCR